MCILVQICLMSLLIKPSCLFQSQRTTQLCPTPTGESFGRRRIDLLVGEKKGGVERASKQLQPFGKTLKLDSARHCQMWQLITKNRNGKTFG